MPHDQTALVIEAVVHLGAIARFDTRTALRVDFSGDLRVASNVG